MKKIAVLLFVLVLFAVGCSKENKKDKIITALLDTGVSTLAIESENLLDGYNYVTDTLDTEDRINHGTAVASTILGSKSAGVEGMAPNALLVPLVVADKVDGEQKTVSPETLARAVRESVDKYGASIINVSLGIREDNDALREAVLYAQKKGALIIAAAGNSGDNELYYPAAYDGVLTVGSHDKDMEISSFTQQNDTVDILAPGEDIWLASRNGKTYGARGTSYATGFVTAKAVSLWEENPKLSAKDIKKIILEDALDVGDWKILNM